MWCLDYRRNSQGTHLWDNAGPSHKYIWKAILWINRFWMLQVLDKLHSLCFRRKVNLILDLKTCLTLFSLLWIIVYFRLFLLGLVFRTYYEETRGQRAWQWIGGHIRILRAHKWVRGWESLALMPLGTIYRQCIFTSGTLVGVVFTCHFTGTIGSLQCGDLAHMQ